MLRSFVYRWASLVLCFLLVADAFARRTPMEVRKRAKVQQVEHNVQPRGNSHRHKKPHYRFLNKQTEKYLVKSLPLMGNLTLGEMYSGVVPIDMKNTSRGLFYIFQPRVGGPPVDEVTIWFNGGPGCSSLEGFLQETGYFSWQPGTYEPVDNLYSWANLTNMMWVEYPVGVGFSIGDVTATTEEEAAEDFVNFFRNFQKIFGISNFKIYVTGESYAGRYVPYVSAAMLNQNNKEHFDLAGALVYDPCIGQYEYSGQQATIVPFVQANANFYNFNSTFLTSLAASHESCGYSQFLDEYLTFPASGVQPPIFFNSTAQADCNLWGLVYDEAYRPNPCFDVYSINQQCPILFDPLGFPTDIILSPDGWTPYFNRPDVKQALHAPMSVDWAECTGPVFLGGVDNRGGPESSGDLSADPIQKVLPQVIEATNRVLVSNGDYDMEIITNGTLVSIQNMTWNGALGFQTKPTLPINILLPDLQYQQAFEDSGLGGLDGPGQGIMGVQHYERGLMWSQNYQTGHMAPQFQPRLAYRHLQWVLGRIDEL